jgi:hypothetical protein
MAHTRSDIVALLPQLRGYARSLTDRPGVGDFYLRVCLELIVADPGHLSPGSDLKGELFRLFRHVWFRADPRATRRAPPSRAPRAWRRASGDAANHWSVEPSAIAGVA